MRPASEFPRAGHQDLAAMCSLCRMTSLSFCIANACNAVIETVRFGTCWLSIGAIERRHERIGNRAEDKSVDAPAIIGRIIDVEML